MAPRGWRLLSVGASLSRVRVWRAGPAYTFFDGAAIDVDAAGKPLLILVEGPRRPRVPPQASDLQVPRGPENRASLR